MEKVRVGVLGAYRGTSMINYCKASDNAVVVAICDKSQFALDTQKELLKDDSITYYDNFEDFIKHDMDAVVLANYANEHAPFAIRCIESGKHIFSEVLPVQTMKEAVELIECVEAHDKVYAYGENYCYMPANFEMRKLFQSGKLGEFEYGEGEYIHNGESIWPSITYGDPDHWRNNMYSTYYCTHSLGPLIHASGLRPVSVVGFESPEALSKRRRRVGSKSAGVGIEMVTLENGAVIKSIHGCLYKNSIWYTAYGSKGRAESAREDTKAGGVGKIYVNYDLYDGEYGDEHLEVYGPKVGEGDVRSANFGHGGSDFYSMYYFIEKILGRDYGESIDVYEALDMCLPGMFAFRSILKGGVSVEIPNLRDKAVRELWRNDTACTDPKVAGDQLLPTMKGGTPEVAPEVYEAVRKRWESHEDNRYYKAAFSQGAKK